MWVEYNNTFGFTRDTHTQVPWVESPVVCLNHSSPPRNHRVLNLKVESPVIGTRMQVAVFFFFPVRVSFKPISLWSQVALYKTCPNILCCNLPQLIENLCNITDTLLSSYLCGPPPFLLCSTMKWNWPQMAGNEVLQWVTILLHVYRALKVFIHCIYVSVKDFSTQHMSKQQVSR